MAFDNINITSADAQSVMVVEGLYVAGFPLVGYSADSSLSMDALQVADGRVGVDGKMAYGYVPNVVVLNIALEANSPTARYFAYIQQSMQANKTIYKCQLVSTVPSIGKVYTFANGVMQTGSPFASHARILEPTTWIFHFENVEEAATSVITSIESALQG